MRRFVLSPARSRSVVPSGAVPSLEWTRIGRAKVGAGTTIGPGAVVGLPYRALEDGTVLEARTETAIGRNCRIGPAARILKGTRIADNVCIDGGCTVEQDVDIGERSVLTYHAFVCNSAKIGPRCVIGGFVGERSVVGESSKVFGMLVHPQNDPAEPWDGKDEPAPTLRHHSFVGFGAVVVGGVTIGERSYVAAGAVVTKDVPPRHIQVGGEPPTYYRNSKLKLARSKWFSDGEDA